LFLLNWDLFKQSPSLEIKKGAEWGMSSGPGSVRCFLVANVLLQLGKSFAVTPQAKELVTAGLYSRIRNPIHVFVDVMIFGLVLALHLYWLFALFPVLVAMHAFRAHREAKVLQEKFGQAYLDYRERTWF
jgi:protein-S-isoprenylcysteine O-methyltransferase Ste14